MAEAYRSGHYTRVLCQGDINEFSWPVSVQGKAHLAVNGHSPSQEV